MFIVEISKKQKAQKDTLMTYIKLLTALAGLALLTACGGASPTAKGDQAQTTDCAANPFGASCIAEDINVEARITDCITAGNAGDAKCASLTSDTAMNTAINTCLANPFDDSCTASSFTFSTYADMARTNRVSFCGMTGNETDALCPPVVRTCQTNPFGASCGAYFESTRITHCGNNPTEAPCVVNTADWLAGFDTPPTAGDYTRTETIEFLQGTANGLDAGTVKFGGGVPTPSILTLGGEAKNGMAWFEAFSGVGGDRTPTRLYSGIFSGTSLGAPLTSADASVTVPWAGKFGWRFYMSLSSGSSHPSPDTGKDFDLTVDFANNEIRAFVKRSNAADNTDHFLLKATFDGTGRFEGTINHGAFAGSVEAGAQTDVTNGIVTGIIGKQGAVGAFISNEADIATTDNAFAGGFVAAPPSE